MFCLRVCCCLLLLCSRVPSPAVRASSSSLPAELTRPFFFCTSSTGPTHYSTPRALSLAHATSFHRLLFVWSHWIVLSPSSSNRSNELNSSGTYFNPILSFLSSVLHHWRSRLRFGDALLVLFLNGTHRTRGAAGATAGLPRSADGGPRTAHRGRKRHGEDDAGERRSKGAVGHVL